MKITPMSAICRDGKRRAYIVMDDQGHLHHVYTESDAHGLIRLIEARFGLPMDESTLVGVIRGVEMACIGCPHAGADVCCGGAA
jgi:hypothetical protein